jgi:hypothetical protein
VRPAHTQVAVERDGRLVAERAASLPPAFAEHDSHMPDDVEVSHVQAHELVPAHPCVEKHSDDGSVPTLLEDLAGAGGEERPQLVIGQYGYRLLGHDQRFDVGHRVLVDLALL